VGVAVGTIGVAVLVGVSVGVGVGVAVAGTQLPLLVTATGSLQPLLLLLRFALQSLTISPAAKGGVLN
jgi:hypothetical protein